jgi:hypothetical protein
MLRLVTSIAFGCVIVICAPVVAQPSRRTLPKPAECYIAALGHLARGDYNEAHAAARQANKLRPNYKPYTQLLAKLEPVIQRNKLRDYALAAGKDDESSVERLAQYLMKGAEDEESRAWLLYCWITDRIAYDAKAFLSGEYTTKDYSPGVVLKERQAVCDGYSKLYTAVGKGMGLDVVSINGHAKGLPVDSFRLDDPKCGHAWNAIKIAGKWQLVDATWGAGWLKEGKFDKGFVDYYFCPPLQALVLTHFPQKREDQYLDPSVSHERFISWPFNNPGSLRALLVQGFAPSAIQDKLAHNIRLVEAYSVPCPLKVQAPLEQELDTRKQYIVKVDSLVVSDMAIIHAGKWYFARKSGDVFTCTFLGMDGEMMLVIKPFGQKEYTPILKYRGVKGRDPARAKK